MKEKRCLPLLLEVLQDAEVSYYCPESHKGLSYNEKRIKTEDDENESPATMTPMKKTEEDFDRKRMSLLYQAVGILKEVNETPTPAAELSEEDAFEMVVAEAEFHGSEQITTGHIELSSYIPTYGAPGARAAEKHFHGQFSTF